MEVMPRSHIIALARLIQKGNRYIRDLEVDDPFWSFNSPQRCPLCNQAAKDSGSGYVPPSKLNPLWVSICLCCPLRKTFLECRNKTLSPRGKFFCLDYIPSQAEHPFSMVSEKAEISENDPYFLRYKVERKMWMRLAGAQIKGILLIHGMLASGRVEIMDEGRGHDSLR